MKEIFKINIPILKFFNTVLLLIFFDKIIRYKDFFYTLHSKKNLSSSWVMARYRFVPTFVIGPNKCTLLLVNKNLNGKYVAMAEVFPSMSELNFTQHLSGL